MTIDEAKRVKRVVWRLLKRTSGFMPGEVFAEDKDVRAAQRLMAALDNVMSPKFSIEKSKRP